MSGQKKMVVAHHESSSSTLATYVTGYIFSVYLTVTAYLLVYNHSFSHIVLLSAIIALALIQFIVQIVFFLHLGRETRPRWKLAVLIMMIVVVLILVVGSLWIMQNLNVRMTPQQENNYMNSQQGI
jgi:cytochrome o ubiquinol oxidase operon protein cyoD